MAVVGVRPVEGQEPVDVGMDIGEKIEAEVNVVEWEGNRLTVKMDLGARRDHERRRAGWPCNVVKMGRLT